ncbi:hypothetical protein MMC30_006095 [Trapelia coarctata]|nr:hypothetical protein [Trapelia coarctata]
MRPFSFLVFAILYVASAFAARKVSSKAAIVENYAYEADTSRIEDLRADTAVVLARPPVIKGGCSLEAKDRRKRKKKCVPHDCYKSGGRCVKEDRGRYIGSKNYFQYVERNGGEQRQQWSGHAAWARQLRYDCTGCVCRALRDPRDVSTGRYLGVG